jgi:hypothetical protein
VLDEDASFRGHPSAGGSHGKDWYGSLKRSEKTYYSTLSEFSGEKPCWSLGDPQMLENTHPHLFNIASSKDSFGDNTLRVWSDSKAPRLGGPPFNKIKRPCVKNCFSHRPSLGIKTGIGWFTPVSSKGIFAT